MISGERSDPGTRTRLQRTESPINFSVLRSSVWNVYKIDWSLNNLRYHLTPLWIDSIADIDFNVDLIVLQIPPRWTYLPRDPIQRRNASPAPHSPTSRSSSWRSASCTKNIYRQRIAMKLPAAWASPMHRWVLNCL